MLTGHGSIPTAIEAIKLGATYYLVKPTDADTVVAAFAREDGDDGVPVDAKPMSVERVEWEHIQRVLHDNGGNISATARALSMHRRTLQRKLHAARRRPDSGAAHSAASVPSGARPGFARGAWSRRHSGTRTR